MSVKADIVNRALVHIGVNKTISNVETDKSREAIAARILFDGDRDYVLRDFPWPFATEYVDLALVAGSQSEPVNPDWLFAYRYPSTWCFARRILTPLGRKETNLPPFRIGRDAQGKLIYTNVEQASAEGTMRVTDENEFDEMFNSMLAWKIGAGLGPSLSKIKDIGVHCMQMYEIDKNKCQARSMGEGQHERPLEAEMIRARE